MDRSGQLIDEFFRGYVQMVSLLVTGLFREPAMFAKTLAEWCSPPRQVGEIVISTWKSEIPRFEALLTTVKNDLPPVQFALNLEPTFEFPEPRNFLRQRQTMLNGVLRCSQDEVFKIRTDFYASADLWPTLAGAVAQSVQGPMKSFERRIWTPWIDYEQPFHIADEALFGTRGDLLKLCSKDVSDLSEFGSPPVNAHTMLFKPPYDISGRIFRDWWRAQVQTGVQMDDASPNKFGKLERMLTCAAFQQMLGLYHRYLTDNFVVGFEVGQASFRPTGSGSGVYYCDRQLERVPNARLFARELAGFSNHFYAWTQDSFVDLIRAISTNDALGSYVKAYDDPREIALLSDDSLYDAFVATLTECAK